MKRRILVGLLALAPAATHAQQHAAVDAWQFGNLQQGYCITYLVSPEDAPALLPDDAQPIRLDAMPNAPPILARVLKDQPEYASWMPSFICIYRFGRADVAGREVIAPSGASEMVGMVAFSARVTAGQPDGGVFISRLFTNDKRIARATDSTAMPFQQVKATYGKAAHGDDERHILVLGKSSLIWDGHAAADSAPVSAPIKQALVIRGPRNKPVILSWHLTATQNRSMVGALVVQGKDRLAKLLRKSPIRYLGPLYEGGKGELGIVPE